MGEIVEQQEGVIATRQMLDLGFSAAEIARRAAQLRVHRLYQGVYAVGHTSLTPRAERIAALLAAGSGAFLSHRTAAALRQLRAHPRQIELTVVGASTHRRAGLVIHRTARQPHPDDVVRHSGLAVSSVPRMLIELAAREAPAELERLVTVSVQKRLLLLHTPSGLAALEAALARPPRYPGSRALKATLKAYRRTDDVTSNLERAFERERRKRPQIPEPQRNVHIDGWEIDCYWPASGVALELDGRPYHVAVRDMERDRAKDAALQRIGLIPLRITDFRFEHDLPGVFADLTDFLGLGPILPSSGIRRGSV